VEKRSTWGPAERVIGGVLDDYFDVREEGNTPVSLERLIADAMRSAGLLPGSGAGCPGCGVEYVTVMFRFCRGCGKQG
jgi:hypothetical protein